MVNLSLHLKLGMFHVFVTEDPVKQKGILVFVLGGETVMLQPFEIFTSPTAIFFLCQPT